MGCFSGRLMSAASDQKLFCKLCSPFCCSFNEFVEEKVITRPIPPPSWLLPQSYLHPGLAICFCQSTLCGEIRHIWIQLWYVCCCLVAKLCLTPLQPHGSSMPGSSVRVISQARILERVVLSFSRASSPPRDCTHVSWIGSWVLYHWITREDQLWYRVMLI